MRSLFLWFFAFPIFAADYVVLFKQVEVSISSLEHEQYQQTLQATNLKSVEQLKSWLGSRGVRLEKPLKDLWLVRGAALSLSESDAEKLGKEGWVSGVYLDKVRQMVPPGANLKVAGSLKELETDSPWGLKRMGLDKIRAEFPEIDGSGVRVGVLDTGVQSKHPEIAGTLSGFHDFINGLGNPYDDQGHGTHVSGTIAGKQTGFAPKCSLTVGKIFSAMGSGRDSIIIEAMQWIFDPDGNPTTKDFPQVVSNSWGGDMDFGVADIQEYAPFQLAVHAWVNGGMIPVFAAGNSGKRPNGIPGGLPEPISVGAMDIQDQVAEFSSRGPNLWKVGSSILTLLKPDISAPGVAVTSSFVGNKYATWDGTSMATPHVAGAIALLLQANPKLKFSEVKEMLLATSTPKMDTNYGFGILNAYELVKLGLQRAKK